jgi:preprotein translocase SecE subunit
MARSAKVDGKKRNVAEETSGAFDNFQKHAGGRIERARLFFSEVRNELKRVTWPTQKEVYATTVVVILVSIFFGLYLFALDFGIDSLVIWIMRKFGVGA